MYRLNQTITVFDGISSIEEERLDIVNNFTFRIADTIEYAPLNKYVQMYGDQTNGLWESTTNLLDHLIRCIEEIINQEDYKKVYFLIEQCNEFLESDKAYKSSIHYDESNEDDLGFWYKYGTEEELQLKRIINEYFSNDLGYELKQYSDLYKKEIANVLQSLQDFYFEVLNIYEEILISKNISYASITRRRIEEFIKTTSNK